MDGDWAEPMKIHPKNPSTTFTFLNDLVLRETYNTAWLNNIIKDEIIDDKLIFTFGNKNSKDYFMNYYWNHNYWQKKFRPFLRKLIKTVYGKDYRISIKVEEYIAPKKKKPSNKKRYPLFHKFPSDTGPAKPKRRESLKYDYKYRFRPREQQR